MLRKLEVENFYSIRDRVVLDLTVPETTPFAPGRFINSLHGEQPRVSTVAAFFGANASGKTTVLRAVAFLVEFVQGALLSEKDLAANPYLPFLPFNTIERSKASTRFYAEFDAALIEDQPPCLYSYELILNSGTSKEDSIVSESLRFAPKGKWRRLLERREDGYSVGVDFELKKDDPRLGFATSRSSVINVLAKFNHPVSHRLVSSLIGFRSNVAPLIFDKSEGRADETAVHRYYAENPEVSKRLQERIRLMDLGIEEISIESAADGRAVAKFKHTGHDFPLSFFAESQGTKNFYRLFPLLDYVLQVGGLAVVDEFDGDIHPLLIPELFRWFTDPEINTRGAQLLASCHNATLLHHLAKEEVFITEKDESGTTRLHGLKDIGGIRRDSNLYSKYITGVYGGIPKLG